MNFFHSNIRGKEKRNQYIVLNKHIIVLNKYSNNFLLESIYVPCGQLGMHSFL